MTAVCSVNSTWGALDMSRCTFRNGAPVAAVAVVEIMTDSPSKVKVSACMHQICIINYARPTTEIFVAISLVALYLSAWCAQHYLSTILYRKPKRSSAKWEKQPGSQHPKTQLYSPLD